MISKEGSLTDFIHEYSLGALYSGAELNMSFSTPLRRTCLLVLLAIAIIGCQSVVDSGYGEKGSLVGRMTVPEIEDALQVWTDSVSSSKVFIHKNLLIWDSTIAMSPRTRPQST